MSFEDQIVRLPIPEDPVRGNAAVAIIGASAGPLADLLRGAAGCSPYLDTLIHHEAAWLADTITGNVDAATLVAAETADFSELSPAQLDIALRQTKRRVALITALADLAGVWTLEQVTGALTDLADRAVDLALRVHVGTEVARGKLPATAADAGGILALAMGKMGACELNYSSDIDLIVLFDDSAYDPADRQEARAALIRATRKAVATIGDNTGEGYVFRTDLRLRPDAAVTPVCMSISAALAYYEAEGRTWERAAYIKARACAGNIAAGERFLTELTPFIWRRHLDFATIQDTQDMRQRIRSHKGIHGAIAVPGHNMKLGQGGIREIEFFTQTRQLISGGRDPALRLRGTVAGLAALAEKGWVAPEVAAELTTHYRQHREIEHRIQMVRDAQTHIVPSTQAGIDTIARMMGEADSQAWEDALAIRLGRVEELTDDFFTPGGQQERPEISAQSEAIIAQWANYPALRSRRAQQIFARIEGDILRRMQRAADPDGALTHFDRFLSGLPAGVQILSLFEANPQLIELIVDICSTAPGLAQYLSRHPEVLDAVLGGSFFAEWPGAEGLRLELSEQLERVIGAHDGGYERALDLARRWTHEWQFRTGVHHLRALIGAEEAGRQYADIADATLGALFPVVAREFASRHGTPPGRGAVLVGMGSLGARQLNSASDLDLIVIYDSDGQENSEGKRPLSARAYFSRLTQAMITAVSAPTSAGRAYEVDMRLRPSGRQGPVATSIQAFHAYQMDEAWTWEHLALTRARVIASCGRDQNGLAADFEKTRLDVLASRGTDPRILPDLADMRLRIFQSKGEATEWGAKVGRGRLQDIELFAQSCALRTAASTRGVVAQLRAGQRGRLIDPDQATQLSRAYRFLWAMQCTGRLLSAEAIDLERIGQGGQELLLRETGAHDFEELAAQLAETVQQSGETIEMLIGTGAGADASA